MFRSLRIKREIQKVAADSAGLSAEQLSSDPNLPITLRQINNLPENAQRRVYRTLLPPTLLGNFGVDLHFLLIN
ncbi:MAG TPA: hypothetical protein VJ436_13070, partial [Anaerolineales bacterium]|nr:hypothetical protein [Anaerolineales bacterium]